MKITKSQLRQIIREEVSKLDFPDALSENITISDIRQFKRAANVLTSEIRDPEAKKQISELLSVVISAILSLRSVSQGTVKREDAERVYHRARSAIAGFRSAIEGIKDDDLGRAEPSDDDDSKSTEDK